MKIIKCGEEDCQDLALMNRQLIEDEGSDNPMSPEELRARMEGFIQGEYEAFYFSEDGAVAGYALVKMNSSPYYIRQFFIRREYRRKGLGSAAFRALLEHLGAEADVDVLAWDGAAAAFWKSLGFRERSVSLRFSNKSKQINKT